MLADLVIRNGRFATGDNLSDRAQAVAISGGRFSAVGRESEVMARCGAETKVIDLGGRLAIPGTGAVRLLRILGARRRTIVAAIAAARFRRVSGRRRIRDRREFTALHWPSAARSAKIAVDSSSIECRE